MTRSFVHPTHATEHAGADRAANVVASISSFFRGHFHRTPAMESGVVSEISRSVKAGAPNRVAYF